MGHPAVLLEVWAGCFGGLKMLFCPKIEVFHGFQEHIAACAE